MTFFDSINRAVMSRIRSSRPTLRVANETLVVVDDRGERKLPLALIKRATLSRSEIYGRDLSVLTLYFGERDSFVITEEDDLWRDLAAPLDLSGRLIPSNEWLVRAVAQRVGDQAIDLIASGKSA